MSVKRVETSVTGKNTIKQVDKLKVSSATQIATTFCRAT
jgi:hypothetical protein